MPPLDRHDLRLPAVLEKRLHGLAEHDLAPGAPQADRRSPARPSRATVWKTRRVLTGIVHRRRAGPWPTITSGTCIVD